MKSVFISFILSITCVYGQVSSEMPLDDQFDVVASEWLQKSEILKTYAGVNEYCQNPTFRKSTDQMLKNIHHFDSLIIAQLEDPTAYFAWDAREERKTMKDLEEFETEYSLTAFVDQMRRSCTFRNEIEANADNLKNGVGIESYDGKVLVLEAEITKYLRRIDKLVLRIDEHAHVLEIN